MIKEAIFLSMLIGAVGGFSLGVVFAYFMVRSKMLTLERSYVDLTIYDVVMLPSLGNLQVVGEPPPWLMAQAQTVIRRAGGPNSARVEVVKSRLGPVGRIGRA